MKENDNPESNIEFSAVIPIFNEEENLEVLHTRLTKVMDRLSWPPLVISLF